MSHWGLVVPSVTVRSPVRSVRWAEDQEKELIGPTDRVNTVYVVVRIRNTKDQVNGFLNICEFLTSMQTKTLTRTSKQ